jgi:hypothetical protein
MSEYHSSCMNYFRSKIGAARLLASLPAEKEIARTNISPAERAEVISRLRAGEGKRPIARDIGISASSVSRIAAEAGLILNLHPGRPRRKAA